MKPLQLEVAWRRRSWPRHNEREGRGKKYHPFLDTTWNNFVLDLNIIHDTNILYNWAIYCSTLQERQIVFVIEGIITDYLFIGNTFCSYMYDVGIKYRLTCFSVKMIFYSHISIVAKTRKLVIMLSLKKNKTRIFTVCLTYKLVIMQKFLKMLIFGNRKRFVNT